MHLKVGSQYVLFLVGILLYNPPIPSQMPEECAKAMAKSMQIFWGDYFSFDLGDKWVRDILPTYHPDILHIFQSIWHRSSLFTSNQNYLSFYGQFYENSFYFLSKRKKKFSNNSQITHRTISSKLFVFILFIILLWSFWELPSRQPF